jgi:multicomponent K+:H+ antiporter subunit G
MDMFIEILVSALLVVGGVFGLVGSYGLIKLPDTLTRLHAPTKTATLGVGCVLIASMGYAYFVTGSPSFHEVLIVLFIFLTAPITANFIAKAYLHMSVKPEEIAATTGTVLWAGYAYDEAGNPLADDPSRL